MDHNDLWSGVLGRYGLSERNIAGEELLGFCASNALSIMNTWFQKREIHQGTWSHPATKKVYMIDFVMMRADQRVLCRDVKVMRGADCWSDHMLVRAKLNVVFKRYGKSKDKIPKSFAVYKLNVEAIRNEFCESLAEWLKSKPHVDDGTAEENWEALKACVVAAAEESLGRAGKKQPEWFEANLVSLIPLIDTKNKARAMVLMSNTPANRRGFRQSQRVVKKAVCAAKESWICQVAKEGEAAKKDGRIRWDSIRRLQRVEAGCRPTRPSVVRKEDGSLTQGPEEVMKRWHQHFVRVLNIPSEYREEVIMEMPTLQPVMELDSPPSEEELFEALSKMKMRKAGGKSGILPELMIHGGPELWGRILKLMEQVWEDGEVVSAWRDAVIVPIPKKDDLRCCDNWRGISLLDVVGKIMARILKERLEVVADRILPEFQCGFRKGRGCIDMIFVARQLIEKVREHNEALYILFVDLKKAYDSIPRQSLWKALEKCGVPPRMLAVVKSFHEGMHAEVRIGSDTTEKFEVRNGLRQGCTIAPLLFNIYFSGVVANWRGEWAGEGVNVLYKIGRKHGQV